MAKKRDTIAFSMSFLDIMSCGFGAVILIFIVIQHSTESTPPALATDIKDAVLAMEREVKDSKENMIELKNTVENKNDEIVTTAGVIRQIIQEIESLQKTIAEDQDDGIDQTAAIEALKAEIKELEEEAAALEGSVSGDEDSGSSTRSFVGNGDRQYVTGINLGGEHILILLDSSSSMLEETIVNIIRRRILPADQIRQSEKWLRAIRTVEWILANVPKKANIQLAVFNTAAKLVTREEKWLEAIDKTNIDKLVTDLKQVTPTGGTSLHQAFALAAKMIPEPDSIFLITDGLPTMGFDTETKGLVTSRQRVSFFANSVEILPPSASVNVILFPMEGDPLATSSYWRLVQATGGSFISPSKDWP